MAILTSLTVNDTGFIKLPSGTSAQRSSPATSSMLRYNSDLSLNEYYTGSQWTDVIPERSIVNNGLVLNLDAGNVNSYPSNRFLSYGTAGSGSGADNNVTFAVNGDGTFIRLGFNQTYGGYTIKPTDVVYRYNLGSNGCHYHGNDIPIPAGVSATFSFDYFVSGATNYPSTNFLANFEGALSASVAAPNSNQDTWQRVSFTAGPTGGAGTLRMLLYPGACGGRLADSGYILFKNPKVEFVSSDTGDATFNNLTSATTWIDVSGKGNNGTLVNGASYSTVNGGVIVLDGVDDYVDISSINLSSSNYTVIGAARYVTVTNGRTFSGRNNNWLMGQWNSTTENYYAEGWVSSVGSGAGDTNWRIYAATGDISADSYALYVNGVLSSGPNNGGAQGPNGFTIGRYGPGASEHSNSHIGFLLCYNRVLTASEILQNFNATRSRFGI